MEKAATEIVTAFLCAEISFYKSNDLLFSDGFFAKKIRKNL